VILPSLQFRWDRFLFPLVPMALPWAATGISAVGNMVARLFVRSDVAAQRRRLVFAGTATVAIALASIPSVRYVVGVGEFAQSTAYDLRSAGLWLRDRHPATVMGIN